MARGYRILVVDDDEAIRSLLIDLLSANGHEVLAASDAREAAERLKEGEFDLVLTDLMLPDGDGMDVLRVAKSRPYEPEVLIVTAYGTIDSAVEAVRAGAFDYLTKPIATQKLLLTVDRAAERRSLRSEVTNLRREIGERYAGGELVAVSAGMRRVMELVQMVSAADSSVLIQGESGTGKELVARAIHFRGPRAARPFIAINCAALPEALLESELFGYARGAFTGAASDRKGLFEDADGGSLLLDEIGDMPLLLQGKLLRVLQEGEIRRVGSTTVRRVDVRILASTNRLLPDLIREGRFREDLFYRLNVIPLVIPPLRERPEDIVPLCGHFLTKYATKLGRQPPSLSPETFRLILAHRWPGNVRELENVIERVVTLSSSAAISANAFRSIFALGGTAGAPGQLESPLSEQPLSEQPLSGQPPAGPPLSSRTIQGAEKEAILRALAEADGNQTRAAEILAMGRNTLWRKMKKYGIDGGTFSKRPVP
jgi:two-component system response regulator AtoC